MQEKTALLVVHLLKQDFGNNEGFLDKLYVNSCTQQICHNCK